MYYDNSFWDRGNAYLGHVHRLLRKWTQKGKGIIHLLLIHISQHSTH